MRQLTDLNPQLDLDPSWEEMRFAAKSLLEPSLQRRLVELGECNGIQVLLQDLMSAKTRVLIELGQLSGPGVRLPLIQLGGGDTVLVFYGKLSAAEQFLWADDLKPSLLWLQALQRRTLAAQTLDDSPVMIYQAAEIDQRWVLLQANQAVGDFLGCPLADLVGAGARRLMTEFIHPDDLPRLLLAYDFTGTSAQQITLQYRMLNAQGEYVPVTERIQCRARKEPKTSISVVWHRILDQVDSNEQFSLFKDLEALTQDVSFETGRDFMAHLCRRIGSAQSIPWVMLCANTYDDWWETWVISTQGTGQPNFHFRMPDAVNIDRVQWNQARQVDPNDGFTASLFGDYPVHSVLPLVSDNEPVRACLFLGSDQRILDIEFIAQITRFFGTRLLREISQARISDALHEQNLLLERQKAQLTSMVTCLGLLDTVADEPEFLATTQRHIEQAFELQGLVWVFWASGEWREVLHVDGVSDDWYRDAPILKHTDWINQLEQVRRSDRLSIDKSRQRVFWPIGQSEAGYLVMVLTFAKHMPDLELLQFYRNALALAQQGLVQRESLRLQAMRDSLTGLGNRVQLHIWIKLALPHHNQASLLLFDLNRFKEINDSFGHQFGDKLLCKIGPRISQQLDHVEHYLARLGGDEFALFLPGVPPEEARRIAEMLHAALAKSYVIDRLRFQVEASIGVAHYPLHGADGHELLRCSDVAMYVAKNTNRNFVEFSAQLDTTTPLRIAVLSELDAALAEGQLSVVYQPLMSAETGRTAGFEALIRWAHPIFGNLSPSEFIPIAEMGDGIRKITDFVLHRTMLNLPRWRKILPDLHIAVNISPRVLLDHQFPLNMQTLLDQYQLPGEAIVLELTETTLLVDPVRAVEIINTLSQSGLKVEIDDFGTGYSSLTYLKSLPISALKIDRSFVCDILTDAHNEVIVSSTINMAHNLGLQTVAEGVEDEATLLKMMGLGCDMIQGYYYSKAMPEQDVSAWLERNS
jgi:diguanylate cyclase (GGDEF)-like protein